MTETNQTPTAEMTLQIRTANRDRKAEIAVDPNVTVAEILEAARQNWALPDDYDYIVRCERLGTQLRQSATLIGSGIRANDVIEIQPIADAGSRRPGHVFVWLLGREDAPWA